MKKHPPNPHRKLSQQLLSSFGASLMLIGLATVSITYTSLRRNLEQHVQQRAAGITQGLEFASEGLIETQDIYLIERLVQNYATLPTVIEVSIVGPDGVLVAHSDAYEVESIADRRYTSLHPTLADALQQVSEEGIEMNTRTVLHDRYVVVHFLPFSSTLFNQAGSNAHILKQRRGVAIAVMDLQQMEKEALQSALISILVMVGGGGIILLFMGGLLRQLILSPLAKINLAIAENEDESKFSLPDLPNNEIGFLGATFASVFEQLKGYKQRELEHAERKYVEVAQRYELATRATKVWVWDWNIQIDTFLLDQGLQDWLGHTDMELPCQFETWVKGIYADDRQLFLTALQAHLAAETPEFSCEHRLLNGEGTLHWFLSRGQAMRDLNGKAIRAIGTITDITAQKQAEVQLQLTNEELVRATRLKDEFLATMSHELRTPLNAILGMTESLQEQLFGEVNDRQIKALQTVERSGNHLLELINDILDVAKIEAGQMELDCTSTSVEHLCQSSLMFIRQQALRKQIQLEIKRQASPPDLLIDERRIRQVLINLLNNAVKFTPEGGRIVLKVNSWQTEAEQQESSEVMAAGRWIRFSVIDTGIGIAPENISKLFQPFVQIDSALNRQYTGTGLGLALVKRIVELHGGKVGLTSELGAGSCFTIDLPCAPDTFLRLTQTVQHGHGTISALSSSVDQGLHPELAILLTEDNEANIQTVANYLEAKGYRILLAQNGQAALDLVKTHKPDLILMDIQIPGMDGLEVIRKIRAEPYLNSIPIVALTDLAMIDDRQTCLEAGANEYLAKPVRMRELSHVIQTLLSPVKRPL